MATENATSRHSSRNHRALRWTVSIGVLSAALAWSTASGLGTDAEPPGGACGGAEVGALPPGHPPVGVRELPPGHPPVDHGARLPPGHPPVSVRPALPPGHPPVAPTVEAAFPPGTLYTL